MTASPPQLPTRTTIIMIGPTGAGKSSFCNRFLRTQDSFVTSSSTQSETTKTTMKEATVSYPNGSTIVHRAIDTPGIGDTQGRDFEFIGEMVNFLKQLDGGVNLIVFVMPFGGRASTDFHKTFKLLHVAFGNQGQLWDQTYFVITKCYWKLAKQWESNATKQSEEWKTEMRNIGRECTDDQEWNYDIPIFFVDSDMKILKKSGSEEEMWNESKVQQWLNECKSQQKSPFRGWTNIAIKDKARRSRFNFTMFEEWARSRPPIDMKTLQTPQPSIFT
jgi:predicted GTPase